MIISGDSRTSWVLVKLGVPQGSVLGPLLYLLYTADISSLFAKHSTTGHLYADDVQACVHGSPTVQLSLIARIDALSQDLHTWLSSNRLSLNPNKTQLIWFGTRQQLVKIDYCILAEKFPSYAFSTSVRDLGVTLDCSLSFTDHISNLTRFCYYHLEGISKIGLFFGLYLDSSHLYLLLYRLL